MSRFLSERMPWGRLVVVSSVTDHSPTPTSDEEDLPCFLGEDYVAEDLPPILCVRIPPAAVLAALDEADSRVELRRLS